ncbi:SRPBCC domain-containing protein [Labrys sp. La1]|uniref:SRPBCC family protein n=1 Tax=Labrys sp. La1 TaxID=3404917 RepID=UPI003EB71069
MTSHSQAAPAAGEHELVITRLFKAPRELVFKAWTDPQHLARWPGPKGFSATSHTFDCSPGGFYRTCLHAPDGTDHWVRGTYLEVEPPARLVFTHAWEGDDGNPGPETIVTVTFKDENGQTLMRFHQAIFTSLASRDGHGEGWNQSFDRLEAYLAEVSP